MLAIAASSSATPETSRVAWNSRSAAAMSVQASASRPLAARPNPRVNRVQAIQNGLPERSKISSARVV